jgi:hypothetical protein
VRNSFRRIFQPILLFALGLILSCGGGGYSGGPPPPTGGPIQVTVQPSQTSQTWAAWRGLIGGPSNRDLNGVTRDLSPQVISSALDDLGNDLGINGLRFEIHHNQNIELVNDDPDAFHINWAGFNFALPYAQDPNSPLIDPVKQMQQMIIPLRQRVQARGEPFSFYVSLIYNKSDFPAFWVSNPQEYAEMAQAAVLWLQQKSPVPAGFAAITPDYWAIVNEPNIGSFTPAEIASLIPAVGQRFANMGINTKIQTAETTIPDPAYLNSALTPAVIPYIGLISFHGYDYNTILMPASFAPRNSVRAKAQSLGVNTAMTEICCHSAWGSNLYDVGLGRARDIYWSMTEANVSIWENFGLLNRCSALGCTGGGVQSALALDADLSRTMRLPVYYVLRQYMHFIRPGYTRVAATCSGCSSDATVGQNVKPVAFKSPGGKIVLIIMNDQSGTQYATLNGLPAGTYDITGVDPAHGQSPVTYTSQTIGAGQSVTLTFPAQAVVTFAQR